jgi:hypothetical protein
MNAARSCAGNRKCSMKRCVLTFAGTITPALSGNERDAKPASGLLNARCTRPWPAMGAVKAPALRVQALSGGLEEAEPAVQCSTVPPSSASEHV